MISRDFAKRQVLRLSRLEWFPRDNEDSLKDLITAVGVAETEELAEAVVYSFLDEATTVTKCPMPSEIKKWLLDHQGCEATRRRESCEVCNGLGYTIVQQGIYTAAKECVCR